MAIANGVVSMQVLDGRNEVTATEVNFLYNNATATLANLVSWASGLAVSLDTVTDGQITKIRLSLLIPLPSGIKTAPVSGSDNEKTGLATLLASGTPNAFGVDTPAIPNSELIGNQINVGSGTPYAAWIAYLSTPVTTIVGTDRYGNQLTGAIKHAVLTFRKHRRALRRS